MLRCDLDFKYTLDEMLKGKINLNNFNTTYKVGLLWAITELAVTKKERYFSLTDIALYFLRGYLKYMVLGRHNQRSKRTPSCPKLNLIIKDYLEVNNSSIDELNFLNEQIVYAQNIGRIPLYHYDLIEKIKDLIEKQPKKYIGLLCNKRHDFNLNVVSFQNVIETNIIHVDERLSKQYLIDVNKELKDRWNEIVFYYFDRDVYPNCSCGFCRNEHKGVIKIEDKTIDKNISDNDKISKVIEEDIEDKEDYNLEEILSEEKIKVQEILLILEELNDKFMEDEFDIREFSESFNKYNKGEIFLWKRDIKIIFNILIEEKILKNIGETNKIEVFTVDQKNLFIKLAVELLDRLDDKQYADMIELLDEGVLGGLIYEDKADKKVNRDRIRKNIDEYEEWLENNFTNYSDSSIKKYGRNTINYVISKIDSKFAENFEKYNMNDLKNILEMIKVREEKLRTVNNKKQNGMYVKGWKNYMMFRKEGEKKGVKKIYKKEKIIEEPIIKNTPEESDGDFFGFLKNVNINLRKKYRRIEF